MKKELSIKEGLFFGYNILDNLFFYISGTTPHYSQIFLLVDENSEKYCLPVIRKGIKKVGGGVIRIKSGENQKKIKNVELVWEELSKQNADRKALLINLGGGVLLDLGGFAASTYKRGLDYINIPTTLLAQVDASIGGKTGIDLVSGDGNIFKNQIGLFNNPKAVYIFPGFLKTLKKREILSGFAEIIKHALICDRKYWEEIKKYIDVVTKLPKNKILEGIIWNSIEIKNRVVLKDPKEDGIRKILNFGHTIGHSIESHSLKNDKNPLTHGEAVAIGIICESYISYKIAGLRREELNEIEVFIRKNYPKYFIDQKKIKDLIFIMRSDKKNEFGKIKFSLIPKIGKCIINQECPDSIIYDSIKFYLENDQKGGQ